MAPLRAFVAVVTVRPMPRLPALAFRVFASTNRADPNVNGVAQVLSTGPANI